MPEAKKKEYTRDDISIIWKPSLCMHAGECVKGLPEVFNPANRPWIDPQKVDGNSLVKTINKCPSGALSYRRNAELQKKEQEKMSQLIEINILKNGPIIIKGKNVIKDADDNVIKEGEKAALCRCGGSSNKPFCDGTHSKIDFQG
ncbi:MAG: hypothetical protein DWQ05_21405 [Calditrichaeota bacterium]|nr:MAG: hypothetical protein DWQ05_21405 [Calditrichota bacterium]